jgi:putative phage-type endonuclease
MTIHDSFQQYSADWWRVRNGRVTASEAGAFIVNSGKVAEKARLKLICKKLGERAGHIEETFPNDAMKRGTTLEPFAREAYAALRNVEVKEVGFISHDTLPLGCSPDGLIYADNGSFHGLEIKCPSAAQHINWLLADELPEEYSWQVHFSMILAGAEVWDFFSFCPLATFQKTREFWTVETIEPGGVPPFFKRVYRSAFTDTLEAGLQDLCRQYEDMKLAMSALWEKAKDQAA